MNSTITEYKEWLSSLKVGDEVIYQEKFAGKEIVISSIKKITPTGMFRLENNKLFHKNGYDYYGGKSLDIKLEPISMMSKRKEMQDKQKSVGKLLENTYMSLHKQLEHVSMEKLTEIEDLLTQLSRK